MLLVIRNTHKMMRYGGRPLGCKFNDVKFCVRFHRRLDETKGAVYYFNLIYLACGLFDSICSTVSYHGDSTVYHM